MKIFKEHLSLVSQGKPLSFDQAREFQRFILTNQFAEQDLVLAFQYFSQRTLTYEELLGFYLASKEAMLTIAGSENTLDTCGTGGDKSGSFNISTAAALICAAAGVPVAKHGNFAASSLCGSADVLETLGVNIKVNGEQAGECLKECNFVFLLAKNFHPAFRFAAPARKTAW